MREDDKMVAYDPTLATHGDPKGRLLQRFWEVMRMIFFCLTPWFCRSWRRGIFILMGGDAAAKVSLSRTCRLDFPWNISIGRGSSVADSVLIRASTKVTIGSNVCISEGVKVLTASHIVDSCHFDLLRRPVVIHDNVWIAMNALILPGVTIGGGAIVAAGAVVTKDVEPWTVVGGNPAKFIRRRVLCDNEGRGGHAKIC